MRRSSFIFSISAVLLLIWGAGQWLTQSRAAGEFFSRYADIAFDNPILFHYKLGRAERVPGKPLAVVVGSSIARESLDEALVEKELGGKLQLLNFAVFHGRPIDTWMNSEEILRLKPDLVVLPLTALEELQSYNFRTTLPFYFNFSLFELVGPGEILKRPREFFYAFLGNAFFLFRFRDSIGDALLRFGKDKLGIAPWKSRGDHRFRDEVEVHPELDAKLSQLGTEYAPDSRLPVAATEKLMEKLAARDIPLVILPLREHPKFYQEITRLGLVEALSWKQQGFPALLERWARQPGVTVATPDQNIWGNARFADYIHLNEGGRAAFSRWFAGWIHANKNLRLVK